MPDSSNRRSIMLRIEEDQQQRLKQIYQKQIVEQQVM